jgi:hypothetical protein
MSTTSVARYRSGNIVTWGAFLMGIVMVSEGAPVGGTLMAAGALLGMPSVRYHFKISTSTLIGWFLFGLGTFIVCVP